jgi:hypothetical protein
MMQQWERHMSVGMTLGELEEFERPAQEAKQKRLQHHLEQPDESFATVYRVEVGGVLRNFTRVPFLKLGFKYPEPFTFPEGGYFSSIWDHVETVGELCPIEAMGPICAQLIKGDRVEFAARPPLDHAGVPMHALYHGCSRGYALCRLSREDHGFVPEAELIFMLRQ